MNVHNDIQEKLRASDLLKTIAFSRNTSDMK